LSTPTTPPVEDDSAATPAAAGLSPSAAPLRSSPWRTCAFLLLATLLSYLDRQALSVLAPRVRDDLALDNAQLGLLLSAFFWAYGTAHLFVGFVLDRGAIRVIYAAVVAAWSVCQMLGGLVAGFAGLFAARFLLGVFEAGAQPGAARIIAASVPPRDRAFANGLAMSGGSLGALLAAPVMFALANRVGWRLGFVVLGAAGLLWTGAWLLWARPAPAAATPGGAPTLREPWRRILRDRRFWYSAAGAATTIPILHVLGSWVPTYLAQTWGVPLGAGLGLSLVFVYLGLDVGFLGGGAVVSALVRRGRAVVPARKLVMAAAGALTALAALLPLAPSLPVAVALLALVSVGRAAWGAIFLSFNQDLAPGRVAGVAGVCGAIGSYAGAALIWAIGAVSGRAGFAIPFLAVAALGVAGTGALLRAPFGHGEAPVPEGATR
jgi:ACS family hexuronate transporter-like MFS transporter